MGTLEDELDHHGIGFLVMASVRTARGLRLHRVTQGAGDGGEYSPARLPSLIDICAHVSSSVCLQTCELYSFLIWKTGPGKS